MASQKIELYVYDSATGLPKTGDAANLTFYVSKDYGSVTALGDTSATELDATNAKGIYLCDLAQAETNADALTFSGKSATSGIYVSPQFIYTLPAGFTAQVAQTGDAFARLGAPVGASISADIAEIEVETDDIAAIKAKTDNLPAGFPSNFASLSITAAGLAAVTSNVKKAAAIANFPFAMTDSTTHAPKTGVTVTAQISKDGGAFATCTNSATITEIASGGYVLSLTSSETNCNAFLLRFTGTACDDQLIPVFTQP